MHEHAKRMGLPKMIGILRSSFISRTMKSNWEDKLVDFNNDIFHDPSRNLGGFNSPRFNLKNIEYGMRLMLAPRSTNALLIPLCLITHVVSKVDRSDISLSLSYNSCDPESLESHKGKCDLPWTSGGILRAMEALIALWNCGRMDDVEVSE
ncbi:hypothetical protein Tco_0232758 [Tanacetum coccineum]